MCTAVLIGRSPPSPPAFGLVLRTGQQRLTTSLCNPLLTIHISFSDPPEGVELRVGGSLEQGRGAGGPVSGAAGLEREVECAVRGGIPQPTVIWTLGDVPLEATSVGRDSLGPL
jgi:hypothetical protein